LYSKKFEKELTVPTIKTLTKNPKKLLTSTPKSNIATMPYDRKLIENAIITIKKIFGFISKRTKHGKIEAFKNPTIIAKSISAPIFGTCSNVFIPIPGFT
jgi:hypothetical protein